MTGFMDLYSEKDTFLHRLDPRVKLLAVVLISVLAFILTELRYLLMLLCFILLLLVLARSSYGKAFFALKFVVRFMILITLLWPLFDRSGTPVLFSIGSLDITEPAVWRGATSAARVGCFATVWYILMFTTSQRDLVRALAKFGLRFDYALALSISFRFIPTFGLTIESIKDAQKARALELDKGSILRRSRNYVFDPRAHDSLRSEDRGHPRAHSAVPCVWCGQQPHIPEGDTHEVVGLHRPDDRCPDTPAPSVGEVRVWCITLNS